MDKVITANIMIYFLLTLNSVLLTIVARFLKDTLIEHNKTKDRVSGHDVKIENHEVRINVLERA